MKRSLDDNNAIAVLSKAKKRKTERRATYDHVVLGGHAHAHLGDINIYIRDELFMLDSGVRGSMQICESSVLRTIGSLVQQTSRYVVSDDKKDLSRSARVYSWLSGQPSQMRALGVAIAKALRRADTGYASWTNSVSDAEKTAPESVKDLLSGSSAFDVFLSCVSRFSESTSPSSIEQLCHSLSGSPVYVLETSKTFSPEQYCTGAQDHRLSLSAVLPVSNQPRLRKYFITFQ